MPRKFNPLDTIGEVAALYLLLILCTTWLVAHSEGWSAAEAAWWAVTTVSTTGYGDLAPKTPWGRAEAAFLMVGAWLFNLLLGALVAAKLIVNSDAWTHQEQEGVKIALGAILTRLEKTDAR